MIYLEHAKDQVRDRSVRDNIYLFKFCILTQYSNVKFNEWLLSPKSGTSLRDIFIQ